jgi:hypothetical protein
MGLCGLWANVRPMLLILTGHGLRSFDRACGCNQPVLAVGDLNGALLPRVKSDCGSLFAGFPSVETILRKIQQKHGHIAWLWNATVTSDICISVTLLREAARQEI